MKKLTCLVWLFAFILGWQSYLAADDYPVILVPGHSFDTSAEEVWNDVYNNLMWQNNNYSTYTTNYGGFLCEDTAKALLTNSYPKKTVFKVSYYRANEAETIDEISSTNPLPGYIGGLKESHPSLVWTSTYPAYNGTARVSYANRLKTIVDNVLRATGATKVNLVTYSMGGLVARSYITWFGGTSKVNKLLMFAPPNNGISIWSKIGSNFTRTRDWQLNGEIAEMNKENGDLTSPSTMSFINYLDRDWASVSSGFQYATVSAGNDNVVQMPNFISGSQFDKTIMGAYHTSGTFEGGDNDEAIIANTTYTSKVIETWILKNSTQIPSAPPNISISLGDLFSWSLTTNTVVTRSITINNWGESPLTCTFNKQTFPSWLTCSSNSITIPGKSSALWIVTLNASGLSTGDHIQTITMSTNDPISPQFSQNLDLSIYTASSTDPGGNPSSDQPNPPLPISISQTITINNQVITTNAMFNVKDYMTVYAVTISAQAAVTLSADTVVINSDFLADSGSRLETIAGITKRVVANVQAGYDHSLVLLTDGSVWGTGSNSFGQLGLSITSTNRWVKVTDNAMSIFISGDTSCIIKNDQSLWVTGTGTRFGIYSTWTKATDNVKSVSSSKYSVFIVKSDDSLWAIGGGSYDYPYDIYYPWIKLMDNVFKAEISIDCSYVLKKDGKLYGMGKNANGELGLRHSNRVNDWTLLYSNVSDISCKGYTAFLISNGMVFGTGLNAVGQIGFGGGGSISNVNVWMSAYASKYVGSSLYNTFAITDTGLSGTGQFDYGSFGNGATFIKTYDWKSSKTGKFSTICLNPLGEFAFSIDTSGVLWATGKNSSGQLGKGNTSNLTQWTQISLPSDSAP